VVKVLTVGLVIGSREPYSMFNLTVDFAFLLREDVAASTASLFSVVITLTIASRCIINHESHLVDVQLAILNF
jgi:hypothetical protein